MSLLRHIRPGTRLSRRQCFLICAFTVLALYSYDIAKAIRAKHEAISAISHLAPPADLNLLRVSDADKEDTPPGLAAAGASPQGEGYVEMLSVDAFKEPARDEELKLVRTCGLEYNQVVSGKRYFMYSPSGGFNNQRKELEYGLMIAKLLNRSLLVPMAARHTSRWSNYHDLGYEDTVPMDKILDFNALLAFGTEAVPLNLTIKDMEQRMNARGIMETKQQKYRMRWKGADEIMDKLASPRPVLFLKGPTMYHSWFESEEMLPVRRHIVFAKVFRRIALEIIKHIGTPEYNAIHIRMGDYANRGRIPNPNSFISDLNRKGFGKKSPLYIATEPGRDQKFFGRFDKAFATKYSNHFNIVHKRYRGNFPQGTRGDFIGIVEQMVCVGARKFVGTRYSTFSEWIYDMRKTKAVHFPEVKAYRQYHKQNYAKPSKPQ